MTALDCIRLRELTVNCIVGVYPSEREIPQPLRADVALYLDTRPAACGGGLAKSIDYARLCGELRFLLMACRFVFLEEAAEAICRYVLAKPTSDMRRAQVEAVSLCLTKPQALDGVAIPSIEIHRTADDMRYGLERKPFGDVDIIYETDRYGIYRLRIAPGCGIPCHVHREMVEHEMVLGEELRVQNETAVIGSARLWPKDFAHSYFNASSVEQTVLCVDRPRFIPDDEVQVEEPAGGLVSVLAENFYPEQASI